MSKLHELLSVEPELEKTAKGVLGETSHILRSQHALFEAKHRTLDWMDSSITEDPSGYEERSALTTTVPMRLDYTSKHLSKYWDAVLQKEATNQTAKADIEIDGVVLMKDVPATALLNWEKKLEELRRTYEAIPTLSPGIDWDADESIGRGVYKARFPKKSYKTAKTFMSKILVEPTEFHPAQVEKWEETRNVGIYSENRWSGAISSSQKFELLTKVDKVLQAVKKARQRANCAEVVKVNGAQSLFNYIHEGLV